MQDITHHVASNPSNPLARYVAFASVAIIWGTTWVAIKLSLQGYPPVTGAMLRFVFGIAMLGLYARVTRLSLVLPRHTIVWVALSAARRHFCRTSRHRCRVPRSAGGHRFQRQSDPGGRCGCRCGDGGRIQYCDCEAAPDAHRRCPAHSSSDGMGNVGSRNHLRDHRRMASRPLLTECNPGRVVSWTCGFRRGICHVLLVIEDNARRPSSSMV
jgi:hypothetical protein